MRWLQPGSPEIIKYLLTALITLQMATSAAAISVEELNGINISVIVGYDMRVRRAEGTFSGKSTLTMKFKIDSDARIVGEVVRTAHTPRGPISRASKMNAPISRPGSPPQGGDAVWIIEGDKLILLRAFESGGFKTEISFEGTGADMKCSVRAPFMREEGAGNIRQTQSVKGGPATILSAKETSAECKLWRD